MAGSLGESETGVWVLIFLWPNHGRAAQLANAWLARAPLPESHHRTLRETITVCS